MTSVVVWEHENLSTLSSENSNKITLVCKKIQSPNGSVIRSISSRHTGTLVCCQDGSVHCCTHDSEHSTSESILKNLAHVKGLQKQNVIQVAAGASHNVVLTDDHRVFTWGENEQLGREVPRKYRKRAKLVQSLASHCVLQISCGSAHTLALSNDGLVFAWGSNSFGQLGLGKSISQQNLPEVISSLKGIPVMLLTTGSYHSFILSKSGSVYGWGRNDFGQLGLSNTENCDTPKKCRLLNDKMVKYICCGENHTACLTKDGSVFTFGAGSFGQLGHCSGSNETAPKQVMDLSGCEVSQIACGSNHTLAHVPSSGRLHIFGFGGSGHFSVIEEGNENGHISLAGHFVKIGDNQHSAVHTSVDNWDQHQRIKTIHAGGNHSFITLVSATQQCESDDFRIEDPSKQILTLSQEKIDLLYSLNPDETPSDEFAKIFSSASCLNGSFLLPNEEHYGSSSKKHGVDMNAVREFFKEIAKKPNIMEFICAKIENDLIRHLPASPPDIEAIRLYLMLPECDLFDKPSFHSSLICQLAMRFLALNNTTKNVFMSWWPSNQPSFFKRLVVIFKQCVQYLVQLPYSVNIAENVKKNSGMLVCLHMLKELYQANEVKKMTHYSTFIVPDLKDIVDIEDDLAQCTLMTISGIPVQALHYCNYPFVFDAEMKSKLFQTAVKMIMKATQFGTNFQLTAEPSDTDFYCTLFVDRQNMANDTFSQLQSKDVQQLKKPLWARFNGEKANGDGVMKEFFRKLFQELMSPDFGLFTTDDTSKLLWFNTSTQQDVGKFRLVGILCGLVIYNSVAVDLHFPLAMYKKLLKKPVNLDDVKELMPVVGRSFLDILDYDGDDFEDLFNLTFEFGATADSELYPGGANQVVNQSNKNDYANLAVDYLLNKSVEAQFHAFSQGFYSACGLEIMKAFQPEEMRSLVEGNEDYDFTELEKNTKYEGVYYRKHPTIIFFWEVFHEMSLTDKKKFLLFLTGSDRIPITGMKDINITIRPRNEEDGMLPFAFTCYSLLCLPCYQTKEQMQEHLHLIIHQTEGFWLNEN